MFEEYLADAKAFYDTANAETNQGNERLARRYYRSAIFHTLGAIEAYVNYVASGFKVTNGLLSSHEIAFLNDTEVVFDAHRGQTNEKKRYYSIEDKVKFLLKRYPGKPSFDVGSEERWDHFIELKDFRDKLIHPREIDDEIPIKQYRHILSSGLKSVIAIINIISQKIYNKPLRRGVLDLIPD